MVSFLTFFLGLTIGVRPIEVAVDRAVARVEIRLDGVPIGVLDGAPWRLGCDFGERLLPDRLEAIAYDEAGREIGRADQAVNLPRLAAEATIALTDYRDGRYQAAELAWRTVDEADPEQVVVRFDGDPLTVVDPRSFELPDHDPERIHILSAELVFSEETRARVELAFGGQYGETVRTELTAVAVELVSGKVPSVESLQGLFLVGGRAARVVAVERGSADVFAVRERSAIPELEELGREAWQRAQNAGRLSSAARFLERGLGRDDSLSYVLPSPREVPRDDALPTKLFEVHEGMNKWRNGGIAYAMTHLHPETRVKGDQMLASATALAGVRAAAANRRRAVVLVLGEGEQVASGFEPLEVRHFLRVLQVPFFVWRLVGSEEWGEDWGNGHSIRRLEELNRAARELRDRLAKQFVVWLDGVYLPQMISLSEEAGSRLRLAGS